jgi:membrane protein implicated in regulation of membrane protease activity
MNANIIVPVVLFVLLAPGFLVALPPGASYQVQLLTHAVVFGAVYWGLRRTFPQYY